ncbi:hypothetical protein Ate02nite_16400 [Paractinoplanes tereljensis]|uniref:Uncharacterized protein n=1 Tax=Paractinoplanes tereljensis TaxID=571912 RepID=A0A919NHT4_9ACTN|nr:hypothetical protein Ate02nite_16400 [Actinoplanes tereljensis]
MAVADPMATGNRRGGREGDTLYRRPPAHPPADSTTGGSWFTDGTDMPSEAETDSGAASSRGSGRASFGFGDGPISPKRSAPTSGPPASAGASSGGYEPLPSMASDDFSGSFEFSPTSSPTAGQPISGPPAYSPPAFSPASAVSQDDLPVRRQDSRRPAPAAVPNWPSSGSGALRGPSGALRAPSGEIASWGKDTGERRVVRHDREREPAAEPVPAPRQSRAVTIGMIVLSAIVVLAGAVVGVVYFSGSDEKLDGVLQLGAGDPGKRTVSAPLDNRTKASFELLAGANSVKVTIGELGDDLYRISTPDDAGFLPNPTIRNDDIKLQVSKDGDGTGGEIEVVLAAKVRWALRFSGYAEKQVIDVSGGQISGLEMVAGMRTAQLTLSRPTGTVPVKINGAVDSLILKSPAANPVRIKVGGGAQTVVAGSRTLKDVAAGSTLTPKGWDVANRYDVTAGARITSLTVENA